jgi:hypothetical protein
MLFWLAGHGTERDFDFSADSLAKDVIHGVSWLSTAILPGEHTYAMNLKRPESPLPFRPSLVRPSFAASI